MWYVSYISLEFHSFPQLLMEKARYCFECLCTKGNDYDEVHPSDGSGTQSWIFCAQNHMKNKFLDILNIALFSFVCGIQHFKNQKPILWIPDLSLVQPRKQKQQHPSRGSLSGLRSSLQLFILRNRMSQSFSTVLRPWTVKILSKQQKNVLFVRGAIGVLNWKMYPQMDQESCLYYFGRNSPQQDIYQVDDPMQGE